MRSFDSLSEREVLALAISLEEEDERVYAEYAEGLRQAGRQSGAILLTVSHLDGAFGLAGLDSKREPVDGALAGLAKIWGVNMDYFQLAGTVDMGNFNAIHSWKVNRDGSVNNALL